MRTRMVRVRQRPRGIWWALVLLAASMALYIKVSLPALGQIGAREEKTGERVTREVEIVALEAYLISFGTWESEAQARVESGRYVPRGAAGYVLTGEKFSVIGALCRTRTQAEKICMQLSAAEGISCTVLPCTAEGLTLRMTALDTQIEAFIAAEQVLRETWQALGELAFCVDRKEATVEQALAVVRDRLGKAERARTALQDQTKASGNEIFLSLLRLLDNMIVRMQDMLEESGAMALSSRLKFCQIECAASQAAWMRAPQKPSP